MIADAITPAIADGIVGSIGGVTPPVASPIARVAQATSTTLSISITPPGGANTLLDVIICNGANATAGADYTMSIGGVSIPLHQTVSAADEQPMLAHFYVNSSAFQALTGAQTITITGVGGNNFEAVAAVYSNVDAASPIKSFAKYEASEVTNIVTFSGQSVTANDFVRQYVVHDLARTWDTFSGVTSAHEGGRMAVGQLAVTTTATGQSYSISHSAGTNNSKKSGLLIQYNAA